MVGYGSIEHLDLLVTAKNNNNYGCSLGTSKGGGTSRGGGGDKKSSSSLLCCSNEYRTRLWKPKKKTSTAKTIQENNNNNTTTKNNKTVIVEYKTLNNVYIRHDTAHGKLTVSRDSGFAGPGKFGPEVMIGWTVGEAFQQQQQQQLDDTNTNNINIDMNAATTTMTTTTVLLIKTAWKGRSLGIDFRPPSSGLGNYGKKPEKYGRYYRMMIHDIKNTLQNLDKYVPTYNKERDGYDLMGFITWLQGWNDFFYSAMIPEYGTNLANLIRDVRHDLKDDRLPVVIGELGMHGVVLDEQNYAVSTIQKVIAMRNQQYALTLLPEFRNNTLFVRTAPFVIPNGESYTYNYVHYRGRADSYFQIGKALGKGMLQLLGMNVPVHHRDDDVCPQPWPQQRKNATTQYHCDAITFCSSSSASSASKEAYCTNYSW